MAFLEPIRELRSNYPQIWGETDAFGEKQDLRVCFPGADST